MREGYTCELPKKRHRDRVRKKPVKKIVVYFKWYTKGISQMVEVDTSL